ncbi:MAG: transglutaminase domain-containing protein [Planctomycetaceae bacterium]|nr:transglutaminase domain-containing protein [Planctomycetaceae bacterium]
MSLFLRWTLGTLAVLATGFAVWTNVSPAPDSTRSKSSLGTAFASPREAAADIVITPGQSSRPRRIQQVAAESNPATKPASKSAGSKDVGAASDTTAKPSTSHDDETWQVILLDEQRIGWSRTTLKTVKRDNRSILRTTNDVTMKFRRFGQQIDMQKTLTTEETPEGDLLSYTMELRNPPAATATTTGTVRDRELRVDTTLAGKLQTVRLPWDAEIRSPAWQERALTSPPLASGNRRSFKSFFPDFNKVATVKIQADQKVATKMLDGRERMLLKARISNDLVPDMVTRVYLDETGKTLRTDDDLLGKVMTLFTVPQAEAMKELSGPQLDIATNTLVPCGPIKQAHKTPKATYRITLKDDDPEKYLSEGETQTIHRISAETVELKVTTVKLPRELKSVPIDEDYVRPTQFLQSRDPRVVEHAKKAALGVETSPLHAAVQMERYVHRNLKKKNFSTALASAAEVAQTLEGDCTEHAVLLAAMLRAQGIPSRVAVGLVYVENVQAFGGHMWTEAWLGGHWYPLDATLGQGGIGAGHIRLAESSFAADAPSPVTVFMPLIKVLGRVKIEYVAE